MLIDSFTVGGAQRQFCTLAKELHKTHDLTVLVYYPITSHFEEELITDGVRIVKILKKSRFDVSFIYKFLKFIRKERFDVSISFLDTPNFYNVLAKITGSTKKIIVSQRSAYFKESLSLKKKFQESLLYFANHITTNSITQKQRMEGIFPFLKGKISYLPNAYKIPKVADKLNRKSSFIVLSNTEQNKNPLQLCKAIVEYQKLYGNPIFKINWYGRISNNLEDKKTLNEGLKILELNNLLENLTFKGITDTPLDEIAKSDMLLHLSNYEGCPNSVCEAMIYKTPVLLSNVCDAPYLLGDNRGILVDQNSPINIAKEIRRFESLNQDKINRMTETAQKFIRENLQIQNSLKTLKKLL